MKFGATLVVLLGLAVAANAGITLSAVQVGPTTGLPGYSTWELHMLSPEKVTAVDGQFVGPMNQVFSFGGTSETPYPNSPGYSAMTATQKAQDSHILLSTSKLSTVRDFHETDGTGLPTNKLAGWVSDVDGNFVSWTTAAVGILAAYQAADLNFAQLVIPDGQTVHFSGNISGNGVTGLPQFNIDIGLPEPATMGLLAAGALALIRRRR